MQMTIYYNDEDVYLIDRAKQEAASSRQSLSGIILTALESFFLEDQRLGEVLVGMGRLKQANLKTALNEQKKRPLMPLGELLVELVGAGPGPVLGRGNLRRERLPEPAQNGRVAFADAPDRHRAAHRSIPSITWKKSSNGSKGTRRSAR